MSEKELAAQLLDSVPEYKLRYVISYLQGLTADEAADDEFCVRLYEDYLNDPDPDKDEEISLEDCMREWGLSDV